MYACHLRSTIVVASTSTAYSHAFATTTDAMAASSSAASHASIGIDQICSRLRADPHAAALAELPQMTGDGVIRSLDALRKVARGSTVYNYLFVRRWRDFIRRVIIAKGSRIKF